MHLNDAERMILSAIASSPTLAGVVRISAADFSLHFPSAAALYGWDYAFALQSLQTRAIVCLRDGTVELSTAAFEDVLPLVGAI